MRSDVLIAQLDRRVALLEDLAEVESRLRTVEPDILAALAPVQHPDLRLERIGSEFDGGYVLPTAFVESATGVVSIGVGDNNDADVALASRGLRVHAWDHTVRGLPKVHESITFHRVGVAAIAQPPQLATLERIVTESFGSQANNLLLLMDAEGAEWDVFASISDEALAHFSVISLELHGLGDAMLVGSGILHTLSRLRTMLVPVVVHPNNHGASWCSPNFVLPDALEVTYVRGDLLPDGYREGNCPDWLMAPCCPDLPDLRMNWLADTELGRTHGERQ